uniref:G domain-containing protein n=1 Tax=Steinernema glaseri TaxID=37863 RepID=A0A1I7Y4D0_9BILA
MTGRVDNISIFLNRCKIDWSLPKDEYVYVTEVIKDATYFFSGTDALFVEVATVKENQWSSIKRDYKGVNIRRSINYGFYFFTLDARKSGNLPRKYALARDPIRMLATPLTMCGSEPHRVILLLGASGSGKTTLLNHIPSYLKFADPETFFQSYEVCPFPPHKKTEEPRTFSFEHNLHVYTFVDTPGLNIGDSPEDNHRRMDHIMQSLLAFHSISTICITLNTFADSHSVLLPYQLRHWLSYLPVECCKSILFVASRANDDLRNKTLQKVLQKQLQLITSCRPDLDIRCRLLFFDNVAVDARNLRRTGPLVDSNYMNNAWSDSKAAFGSLVKEIADCEPILLKKCVDVLEQRRTFEDIAMSTKHATVEQEKMRDSLYRLRNRSYGNTNDSERIRCLNKTLKDLEKKKREDDNSARKSLEFLKSKSIVAFNICEAQYIYYLEKNKFPLKPAIADVWTWKKNLWTSTVQKENLVSRARNTLFCRTKKSEINAQIGFEELVYQGNNDGSNSSCIHKVLASVNQSYEGINIIVPTMPIIPAPYGTDRCSVAEDSRPVVDSSLLPEKKPCAKIKVN